MMTALEFYQNIWIKQPSSHSGIWPIRFAEAYKDSCNFDAYAQGVRDAAKACKDLRENRPATERGLLIATECELAILALLQSNPHRSK